MRAVASGSRWLVARRSRGGPDAFFLAGRAIAGVNGSLISRYGRTVAVGNLQGWLRVAPVAGQDMLSVELATSLMPALPEILARLKNLFDLSARPDVIANHLSADSRLARIVTRCPGLRVPGAFFGFELAIRAILGQRISVRAATTLAGRLADRFGEPTETPVPGLTRLSPTPARLASANEADLTALGSPPPAPPAFVPSPRRSPRERSAWNRATILRP